jgi:hypothetical protein
MDWTGPNKKKLRKALIDIYNSPKKLAKFVNDEFDVRLDTITNDSNIDDRCYDLIEEADSQGWIDKLYENFCEINKDNLRTRELLKELNDTFRLATLFPSENIIGESDSKSTVSEDNQTGHLVIALFKEGTSREEKLRIHAKFCYYENPPKTLEADNIYIKKDEVYKYLEERISDAKKILIELSNGKHFELVIELFLPIDLLSSPLHQWYGQENKYLKLYPIVIGCSDRFISDEVSHSSFDLRNRLKKGWSRFQAIIPDEKRLNISELKWLKSDDADMESLADFTSFCCSGNWLQAGEEHLEKWEELILSGIPLALWRCNTHLARENLTVFEHLIAHNRFDFLMRIPNIRERQQKMKEDYVGVFYEDIDYLPDIPKQMKFPGT